MTSLSSVALAAALASWLGVQRDDPLPTCWKETVPLDGCQVCPPANPPAEQTCSGVVCKHEFKGTSLRDVEGGSPGKDSWAVAQDPHRCHATYKRCGVNGQCVVNYSAVSSQQRRVPGGVTCP